MKPELGDILEHHGVKGMHWGRHKAGSTSANEKGNSVTGAVKSHINSIKREHSWNKTLRNAHDMSTSDLQKAASRAQLENDLKRLSKKSDVGSSKDKQDYLNRGSMKDEELFRKVQRLRAKDSLSRNATEATRKQREIAKKVVAIAAPIIIQYALTRSLSKKDIFNAVTNPNGAKAKVMKNLMETIAKQATKHSFDDEDILIHVEKILELVEDDDELWNAIEHSEELLDILEHAEEDDDTLEHHGVKGMHWGVHKRIQTAIKTHLRKRNAAEKKKLDAYHEKMMAKHAGYKILYNRRIKRNGGKHYAAVRHTRETLIKRSTQNAVLVGKLAVAAAPFAVHQGMKVARKVEKFATNPDNVRKGKNIMESLKRSPIRYVDGKNMKNIIN